MSASTVPPRFAVCTLDAYQPSTDSQRQALTAARMLVVGEIRNLILVGPPGVGKTHLAAGIVDAVYTTQEASWLDRLAEAERSHLDGTADVRYPTQPVRPMWANVADLIVRLRIDMDRPLDDREASATIHRMRSHPALVVLDDLGREKVTDWTAETLYALVNARYEAMLPTVVTSNLTAQELAAGPYWPSVSRLAEDGDLVKVDGPDRRLSR